MTINKPAKRHSNWSLPMLALSFGAATGLFGGKAEAQETTQIIPPTPVTMTQTQTQSAAHSFWRHPDYDAVMEVWVDKDKGLRGKIVSLNAADRHVREAVGKILKKKTGEVTDDNVKSFSGLEGDLTLKQTAPDKWSGTIYWPYKDKSYGVDVEISPSKMHVHGFLLWMPIFCKDVDLKPAEKPPLRTTDSTPPLKPPTIS